jgi:hypothetical protein
MRKFRENWQNGKIIHRKIVTIQRISRKIKKTEIEYQI